MSELQDCKWVMASKTSSEMETTTQGSCGFEDGYVMVGFRHVRPNIQPLSYEDGFHHPMGGKLKGAALGGDQWEIRCC